MGSVQGDAKLRTPAKKDRKASATKLALSATLVESINSSSDPDGAASNAKTTPMTNNAVSAKVTRLIHDIDSMLDRADSNTGRDGTGCLLYQ